MSYVVVAKMAWVKVPAAWTRGNRPMMQDLMLTQGQPVPEQADPASVAHLLAGGLIEELPPGEPAE